MGFAGVASIGAAAGGFAASQGQSDVVSVVTPRPPLVEPLVTERVTAMALTQPETDLERWAAAFMDQPAALVAQVEMKPWRFVGVIGEGRSARAVFASPDSGQTMMASQGQALPDGRIIAAIASEHVLFAASQTGPGGVATASGVVGPKQISLFNGGAGNQQAAQAYADIAAARTAGPMSAAIKTVSAGGYVRSDDAGYVPPSWVAPPASAN
jgi:hypothetical protein